MSKTITVNRYDLLAFLLEVGSQATRKDRASNLKRYLIADLNRIARLRDEYWDTLSLDCEHKLPETPDFLKDK